MAPGNASSSPFHKDLPVVRQVVRRRHGGQQDQQQLTYQQSQQMPSLRQSDPYSCQAGCHNPKHCRYAGFLPPTALYMTTGQLMHSHKGKGRKLLVKDKNGHYQNIYIKQMHQVGKGPFGKVVEAEVRAPGRRTEMLALKITKQGEEDLGVIEATILLQLDHPNVVDLKYYYYEDPRREVINLLMELVDDGDLYHIIHQHYSTPNGLGPYAELFAFQIFRALAYIHSKGIAHRDIKPENVLCSMTTGTIKLADFNCATKMGDKPEHSPKVGTKIYNAPELSLGSRMYNVKVDVWSAGVVMTAMIVRRSVFLLDLGSSVHHGPFHRVLEFLGSPTEDDFECMKVSQRQRRKCPRVEKSRSFHAALQGAPGISNFHHLMDLIPRIFTYKVHKRYSALDICAHELFDNVRLSNQRRLPNGAPYPHFATFSRDEIRAMNSYNRAVLLYT